MQVFQTLQIWDGYNILISALKKSEGFPWVSQSFPWGFFSSESPEELSNGRLAMMSIFVTFLLVPRSGFFMTQTNPLSYFDEKEELINLSVVEYFARWEIPLLECLKRLKV